MSGWAWLLAAFVGVEAVLMLRLIRRADQRERRLRAALHASTDRIVAAITDGGRDVPGRSTDARPSIEARRVAPISGERGADEAPGDPSAVGGVTARWRTDRCRP